MTLDTRMLVTMTDANQNFSKVVRRVDEEGMAVILKNNKPRYLVIPFDEYEEIQALLRKLFLEAETNVVEENLEALTELAK